MMEQILDDEKVVLSEETEADKKFCHLVHVDCHRTDPHPSFVTSMCGLALEWDERKDDSPRPKCPDCRSAFRCPSCKRARWEL